MLYHVVDSVATPHAGYQLVGWTGEVNTIADVNDALNTITANGHNCIILSCMMLHGSLRPMVAAGAWHTVGLRDDGTLVAMGNNYGVVQCRRQNTEMSLAISCACKWP